MSTPKPPKGFHIVERCCMTCEHRAALSIQESLSTHIRLMEDIVQRLEWAAQAASAQDSTPRCENGG